jgi:hypothetical protein
MIDNNCIFIIHNYISFNRVIFLIFSNKKILKINIINNIILIIMTSTHATHAHYVSELNHYFGDNWIITDTKLANHLLCIKYKIKSEYNPDITNINIIYSENINTKDTRSSIININNDNIILTITKPAYNNSDVVIYKIIATNINNKKIDYINYNNIKIAININNISIINNNIMNAIEKNNIKIMKQIEYLKKNKTNDKLIKYLENEIININYEPPNKKINLMIK